MCKVLVRPTSRMVAGVAGQAVIAVVAASIAVTVGYISTGNVVTFQGDVDVGPTRSIGNVQVDPTHGAVVRKCLCRAVGSMNSFKKLTR